MNEEIRMLLKLTAENTKYVAAFNYLKSISDEIIERGRSGVISREELEEALKIAGLEEKEIDVIQFDNCKDVAYAKD